MTDGDPQIEALLDTPPERARPFDDDTWRNLDALGALDALAALVDTLEGVHRAEMCLGGVRRAHLRLDAEAGRLYLVDAPDIEALDPGDPANVWRDGRIVGELAYENFTDEDYPGGHRMAEVLQDRSTMAESGLLQPGLTQLLGVCVSPYGELALRSFDELRGALDQFRRELAEAPRFSVGSASTVGNYIFRRNNQDACGHIVLESTCGSVNEGGGFFCVADGIGGIDDGARASQIAVQSACRAFSRAWNHYGGAELERRPGDFARAIVKVASQRLALEGEFDASQNRGGTTFTGLLIAGRRAGLGHVGDSRAVLVRRARSIQMSRDHTLANIFADLGEEADSEANKRTLSRFLSTGMELESARVDGLCRQAAAELSAPDPDSAGFRVEQGDLFVLTSDGVHDQIDGALFEQTLRLHRSDPRLLANALVQQTLSEVGRDNATAQVVLVS